MFQWLDSEYRAARKARRARAEVDWRDASYVAVDLETNGLHCDASGILSVAWVVLGVQGVALSTAQYHVVSCAQELNQSAVHHGLRERDIRSGEPLAVVMRLLAQDLENRYLVAHHAPFDWKLLQQASVSTGVEINPLGVIDTLMLERQRLGHPFRDHPMHRAHENDFTLPACGARFHLPARPAHHALEDALACGELFLAQAWHLSKTRPIRVRELIQRSRQRL